MTKMLENTIPLPIELLYSILDECKLGDVLNFAATSRDSYARCFKLVSLRSWYPLSLIDSVKYGVLKRMRHATNLKFNEYMEALAVDISKETWRNLGTTTKNECVRELISFLESPSSKCIMIWSYDRDCDLEAFIEMFEMICMHNKSLQKLSIRVSVDKAEESDFVQSIEELEVRLSFNHEISRLQPLYLDIETKALNSRTLMRTMISFVSGLTDGELEALRIAVRWKEGCYYFSNDIPVGKIFLGDFPSRKLKRLVYEDKMTFSVRDTIGVFKELWGNSIQELTIDCGLAQRVERYEGLADFENLTSLSIPFPYQSFSTQNSCCMKTEFVEIVQWDLPEEAIVRLNDISFHYLSSDCQETRYIKIHLKGPALQYDSDSGESWLPETEPRNMLLCPTDLGSKPTDHADRETMRQMIVKPHLRRDWLKNEFIISSLLSAYVLQFARKTMANGDELNAWGSRGKEQHLELEGEDENECNWCQDSFFIKPDDW